MWSYLQRQAHLNHGQAVHYFQISLLPKVPSSLVLFDSFIMNVLQSCCPGQPEKSSMENNIINSVFYQIPSVTPKAIGILHFISVAHSTVCGLDLICGMIILSVSLRILSMYYKYFFL